MRLPDTTLTARFIILLLVGVLIYAVWDHRNPREEPGGFNAFISEFDTFIDAGRNTEALQLLRQRTAQDLSSYQYLVLLKRIYHLAPGEQRDAILRRTSRSAAKEYPGREEFRALYVDALTRAGRPEEALRIAREQLRREEFLGLTAAAALAAGEAVDAELTEASAARGHRFAGLLQLVNGEASSELFRAAGQEWDVPEFSADAALLRAAAGDIEGANRLLKEQSYLEFPQLSLQIAYDAGDAAHGLAAVDAAGSFESSLNSSRSVLGLYRAEFLLTAGAVEAALELYRTMSGADAPLSLIPFINASVLDSENALSYLNAAQVHYPDSPELLLRLGEHYYRNDDLARGEEYFSRLVKLEPDNPAARIRLADIQRGSGSLSGEARLWEAYHREPAGVELGLYLAWRLYGRRDTRGLALLVSSQDRRAGPDQEVIGALAALLEGDYTIAATRFESAYRKPWDWRYLYNAALLRSRRGEYEAAVDLLQRIEQSSAPIATYGPAAQSEVWIGLAENQSALGDTMSARTSLAYALDLDPANLRAALLRDILENR